MSPEPRTTADRGSYTAGTAAFMPVAKEGRMSGRWNQSGVNIPCAGASTDHPVSRVPWRRSFGLAALPRTRKGWWGWGATGSNGWS